MEFNLTPIPLQVWHLLSIGFVVALFNFFVKELAYNRGFRNGRASAMNAFIVSYDIEKKKGTSNNEFLLGYLEFIREHMEKK